MTIKLFDEDDEPLFTDGFTLLMHTVGKAQGWPKEYFGDPESLDSEDGQEWH